MNRAADSGFDRVRRAGVLDVPWMFDLMLEGARDGAFSDRYLARAGTADLLGLLLAGILRQGLPWADARSTANWMVLEDTRGDVLGFYVFSRDTAHRRVYLTLLAVMPRRRNEGHGSRIVERLLNDFADGEDLVVHCTKYARAMQHILKRHRLRRNVRSAEPRIEEYHSNLAPLS